MVLDSGSPVSVISPESSHELRIHGLLRQANEPRYYQLSRLTAEEAVGKPALPDLKVRILPRLTRLAIDGLLGLDFFRAFELTCFRISTSQLLLEYPSSQ